MKRELFSCLLLASAALCGCAPESAAPVDEGPPASADEAVSTPVTAHPRLWVRQADLTRLRGWATAQNPMYQQGLLAAVQAAVQTYDTQFYPGGQPNPTWPDPGNDNWTNYVTEAYAEIFAFMSLVDPDQTERDQYAARAKNLLMYAINQAAKGVDTSANPAPFRSPVFATYNRANYWGEAFGLTVDWIYPYLTAQDKSTIQKVFLRWSSDCLHASTTSNEHPQPIGVENDPQLLSDKKQLRWAANNYFTGHMRELTMMSLALDPADDPVVDPSAPATQLGNSVRSYIGDVTGAWLYQQYAMYEDPAVSSAALGVPASGLGLASGGLSVEGFLYGESLGYLHEALLALHTAGYDDTSLSGPQAGLIQSPYWDRMLSGLLASVAPTGQVPSDPSYSYLGPVYQMASYGDILRFWVPPEFIMPFGSLGALDQTTGNSARLPALRWIAQNVIEGGSGKLYNRASNVWGNSYATFPILYFMLFDPSAATAPDPRPSQPTVFTDKALGRVLARTDWTPQATWFTYLCNWETINHQNGSCNQLELYRKGEWLTKERSNYANDQIGLTSDYHNTLAIQNDVPSDLQWYEQETSQRGGQWTNGMSAGDPTVVESSGTGYAYAYGDSTNLYNRPSASSSGGAMDVVHASRSVVYLEPDHVVVYDRATTHKSSRFKRFNLTFVGDPVISGKTAKVPTPGGQTLTVQNLLPAGATLTASAAENFNRVADLEPTQYRLVVEDPSMPADVRFLHVLQGTDAGITADPATLVSSSSGTAFNGAVVNGTAVLFPVTVGAAFAGTTYAVPSSVTTQVITGLTPGAGYTVSTQASSSGLTVVVSAGGSAVADAGGVVRVSSGGSTPPPPTCSFTLGTSTAQVAAAGGSGSVGVTAGSGCAWTATSNAAWLTVTAGATGTGSGTVGYAVAANTGTSARTAALTVGGQTYTVTQAAAGVTTCSFALSATSASVAAGGGNGSVGVTAGSGCAWTAASNAAWLTVGAGASGTGNGTVSYTATANTGTSARTGVLTVGGQTYTVTQAAAAVTTCSFALSATSASVAAGGGSGSVGVTAGSGCAWTAASNAAWLTVGAGASGTGNGTVSYTAAANTGTSARTGVLTIGGHTYTVTQAAAAATPCAITLPASSVSVPKAGGTYTFAISAPAGCSWAGASGSQWIWLLQPSWGSGNGTIPYEVLANTGAARTGTINIGGKVFTVKQAGH